MNTDHPSKATDGREVFVGIAGANYKIVGLVNTLNLKIRLTLKYGYGIFADGYFQVNFYSKRVGKKEQY